VQPRSFARRHGGGCVLGVSPQRIQVRGQVRGGQDGATRVRREASAAHREAVRPLPRGERGDLLLGGPFSFAPLRARAPLLRFEGFPTSPRRAAAAAAPAAAAAAVVVVVAAAFFLGAFVRLVGGVGGELFGQATHRIVDLAAHAAPVQIHQQAALQKKSTTTTTTTTTTEISIIRKKSNKKKASKGDGREAIQVVHGLRLISGCSRMGKQSGSLYL
jgi:hypothetical protein